MSINITNRKIQDPSAGMQTANVDNKPFSEKVFAPTCFLTLKENIFE